MLNNKHARTEKTKFGEVRCIRTGYLTLKSENKTKNKEEKKHGCTWKKKSNEKGLSLHLTDIMSKGMT